MPNRFDRISYTICGNAFLIQMYNIIKTNEEFRAKFHELSSSDVIIGCLNIKPSEEYIFTDLLSRGVVLFPSALSQQLTRSKCFQAAVFTKYMVHLTTVIRDKNDILSAITIYNSLKINKVITKQDRANCGLGINLWSSIEDIYNSVSFGHIKFPFVLQPFIENVLDVRIIILGNYLEAYWRKNDNNIRNNISRGGDSGIYDLPENALMLCKEIMQRGQFPYAHIDLMITPRNEIFFSEIALRGGIKGAQISPATYVKQIKKLEDLFIASCNDISASTNRT
jgi:glutathione synthase/RimK-type ligase-like ATP-grasp enzyme